MLRKIFIALLFLSMNAFSQTPPIEPGVSQTLARWRAAHYSDVRYKLNLTLEKGAPLMKGTIEIRVNLSETGAKNDLVLDWRTTQFQNDKDKPFANVTGVNEATEILTSTANEHITIPKALLKTGENVIKIQFASPIKTSGAAVTRYVDREDGAEYVYSLFVPSDASTAFPVFDQPDLKARFELTIKADQKWKIVSNTNPKKIQNLPASHSDDAKKQLSETAFEETKPISTYVFAFAAGEFAEVSEPFAVADGLTRASENSSKNSNVLNTKLQPPAAAGGSDPATKIYVRKSQAEKFKAHAAETFRLNRESVKFFESYFDYRFPFPKYDLVLIPEFPFGGMEHAGATFLRESSIIFAQTPTKNDYVSRANLIFHEAAHQWFGDLVTMRWFDDLWLKEGFATFIGYKALEKLMPEYNAWKIFYERSKQSAYLTDATRGTTPIYQEIPNLSAAKSAYGNIVYSKAPSFLKQAEFYLGEKQFQTAVRAFLKKYEFKNATWEDLVKEFEIAGKQNLKDWGEFWVKQPGLPIIRVDRIEEKKGINYGFCISQYDIFRDLRSWDLKFKVSEFFDNGNSETRDIKLSRQLPKPVSSRTPADKFLSTERICSERSHENRRTDFIFPNYQDYGYGIFLLDAKSRDYVLKNIQTEKDDFLRTMMWGALWDSVREAELDPAAYVELVIKNLGVESDESTISTLLSRTAAAMNYYLSDRQRAELAPRLETLLLEKMRAAPTLGQRITFYRAFLNMASTAKARQVLKDILDSKFQIPDLSLKTKDKFDIVSRLLILGDEDAPRILAGLEKTETSDEAKRYAFAARAGIATAESKAKYWTDFTANREISESWIEAAFVPFNSIRHGDLTLPYLERALAQLPALKRNRKIFFVNGWLAAFIGGQRSAEALRVVDKFLADNPNLDKDLRLKILENADALERAVKIRAKFGV